LQEKKMQVVLWPDTDGDSVFRQRW
jgi:hypothetical protein